MKEITINPTAQLIGFGAIAVAVAVAIGTQMPEVKRYLKVRSM